MCGQAGVAIGDLAEHAVEAAGERVEFGDCARFGACGVVLGMGDALHQRGQRRQRTQHRGIESAQGHGGEQQGECRGDHRDRAVGEHLQVERAQVEVEVEHADRVAVLDDRLRHVQRGQVVVRVLGRQAGHLAALGGVVAMARELGAGAVVDRRAAHVGQALEGGEHAIRRLVVEEHQAGGGVVGEHAGHHAGVAFECERADHQAGERDHDRQQCHRDAQRALADSAQLLAERHAGVAFGAAKVHWAIRVAGLGSLAPSSSPD